MKNLTVLYSNRTSDTGKNLLKSLSESNRFQSVSKIVNQNTDVILRWGSTKEVFHREDTIQINTRQAIQNASSKYRMLQLLSDDETINVPKTLLLHNAAVPLEVLREYKREGNFYVRDSNESVRFDNVIQPTDMYITQPIERQKEYRVLVFNGNIIKVYEKVPKEVGQVLMKSYNCDFRRKDITRFNQDALQMCIRGVKKLGLVCGGCDLIKDVNDKFYINEINSGFGLNNPNVELFRDLIIKFVYPE